MKRVLSSIIILSMLISLSVVKVFAADTMEIYVDCKYEENGDGSFEKPFTDIFKAQKLIREIKNSGDYPSGGITVYFREGTYLAGKTIEFTEQDSGLNGAPVTYRSYPMENVTFSGGARLMFRDFAVVEDDRLDESVKGKVYKYNLRDNGYEGYNNLYCTGGSAYYLHVAYPNEIMDGAPSTPEVFFNDFLTSIATYPNNGEYITISEIIEPGENIRELIRADDRSLIPSLEESKKPKFRTSVPQKKFEQWQNEKDMWAQGYWYYDWSDQTMPVKKVDAEQQTIELALPSVYTLLKEQRFFVFNALCEIDSPGEWYYDKDSGVFYIYPLDTKPSSTIDLGFSAQNIFSFVNCSNIYFKDINMSSTRKSGINIDNCSDVTIFGCEVKNISGSGINVSNSKNIIIDSCHVYNIGTTGINMDGGNYETLEPGNNLVQNCWVHDFGRIIKTYNGALGISGVGNTARFNNFHDGTHLAIAFGGNDNVIEYNDVSNVMKEAADMGALYSGRNYVMRGDIIRGNVIHDLYSDSSVNAQYAIYLDDSFSGTTIEKNLFYNIGGEAVFINGGRDNTVTNNIFANANGGIYMTACGLALTWGRGITYLPTLGITEGGYWQSEPYKKYPNLTNLLEDDSPMAPKYNVIKNNINCNVNKPIILEPLISTGSGATEKLMREWSEIEERQTVVKEEVFENAKEGNYLFAQDIKEKNPEFETVDFSKAGLITSRLKNALSEDAVVLAINKPMSYVNWKKRLLDLENIKVVPKIEDDLTYVPVRFLAEMLGAEVSYGEDKAVIKYSGKTLELFKSSNIAVIDGEETELGGKTVIENSRMLVPLRSCGELFDKKVFWDDRGLIIISNRDMTEILDDNMIQNLVDRL